MALWRGLLNFFRRARISQEIEDELRFHLDERVDELMAEGLAESDARHLAARQFGHATLYKERTRNIDISQGLEDLVDDAAYALRSLRRAPAFTSAAVLTLALGIGATTAIYSVVRTIWLRPLPFKDPSRVMRIWETNLPLGWSSFSASVPNFVSWHERSRSFESLVALQGRRANLSGEADPESVASLAVTARFVDALGIRPIRGRSFVAGDDGPGRGQVVMLSERLWQRRYGGDPNLIGRTILVNGERRTVVGIVPLDVGFANDRDVWEPLTVDLSRENRGDHRVTVLGRLKPGVAVGQAEAELNGLAAQLEREFPESNRNWRVRIAPALEWIVDRDTRTALIVLMAAAGLLLAIACINAANLLLARASSRVQEFGVRRSLGASRERLIRQLITESLVLACAGGGAGVGLAIAGVRGLRAVLPEDVPRATALAVDWPVLAMALAVTVMTGILFGLAPAWSAARADVHTSVWQGRRTTASSGGLRLRKMLVAGEFALATILVAAGGMLLASFQRLQSVRLGFQPQNVLTARVTLPNARYPIERQYSFYRDLHSELTALPGVEAVGFASNVPFGGGNTAMDIGAADDAPRRAGQAFQASWRIATQGYFQALRIPLLRGRLFREREPEGELPAVICESVARRLWPDGRDPVGRRIRVGPNRPFTVIGVVGDVRQLDLTDDPVPTVYLPTDWYLWETMVVVLRTAGDPAQFAPAVRRAVAKLDSQQPVSAVRTLEDLLGANSAQRRLNTLLVGAFGALALTLGAVGVAGVVSYSVIQRTPELAVRMALGATPGGVIQTVTASGLRVCFAGLAAGLACAYVLGHAMTRLLFQVRPGDPATLGAVAAVLLAVAVLSSWLPARRIARIDPATALRKE